MGERRKIHLVNWPSVCKLTLEGLNQALLGKWLWRFYFERERFWRKIILGKFEEMKGRWTTKGVGDSLRMSLWKDIRKG